MRVFILTILIAALLAPGLSSARESKHHYGQCRQITKQLDRYDGELSMAKGRSNRLWMNATRAQISRLEARRYRLCPEWGLETRAQIVMAQAREIVKEAAKMAIKYFTMGMY